MLLVRTVGSLGELFNFMDAVKLGETVLVEYSSPNYALDFSTLVLKRYAEKRGYAFVVDDNLDTLSLIREHLRLFGIEDVFSDAIVIKTGGVVNVGRVVERIKLEREPAIYLKRHENASKKVQTQYSKSINVVLGLEKLFAFVDDYLSFYEIISSIERFLGNRNRKAFYLFDTRMGGMLHLNPLPVLENIASTILRVDVREGRLVGRIHKSPNVEMMGWEVDAPLSELLRI